jgi:hypothetical protein
MVGDRETGTTYGCNLNGPSDGNGKEYQTKLSSSRTKMRFMNGG